MAKVAGPFLSLSASGTVGNALTASSWKGIPTMRLKSTPSNPKTTDQMKNRAFLAAGGKVTKVINPTGALADFLRSKTPAGQSYASYFVREILGTQNVNIIEAKAGYELAGNSAAKAAFDAEAASIGLESVDLDGTSNTQIPGGLALWAAYAAARRLGSTFTDVAPASATDTETSEFATAITT